MLNKKLTERGQLIVKKPGKMRWEYLAPERKLFVSDGVKFYSYLPDDKQVIMSAVPTDDNAATPALFLAGKGNLTRDFAASLADVPADLPAWHPWPEARPKDPPTGLRLATLGRRPGHAGLEGAGDGGRTGRNHRVFRSRI